MQSKPNVWCGMISNHLKETPEDERVTLEAKAIQGVDQRLSPYRHTPDQKADCVKIKTGVRCG